MSLNFFYLENSFSVYDIRVFDISADSLPKYRIWWLCAVASGFGTRLEYFLCYNTNITARLAQSVERETLNLKVGGSTPPSGLQLNMNWNFNSFFLWWRFYFIVAPYYYEFFFQWFGLWILMDFLSLLNTVALLLWDWR